MYILSLAKPSLGIEPRIPRVFGWSLGVQTSIVAHSWREWKSEWPVAALAPEAEVNESTTSGVSNAIGLRETIVHLKIAPPVLR